MGAGIAMGWDADDDLDGDLTYGKGKPMGNKPVFAASIDDVIVAGRAIFEHRTSVVAAADPRDSHPMMYSKYKWDGLPASEKSYYCDMATAAFLRFGIVVPDAPVFEAV
jgi:hypothetical protein